MQESIKEKVEKEIADWQYMKELPAKCHGFSYHLDQTIDEDVYNIFS